MKKIIKIGIALAIFFVIVLGVNWVNLQRHMANVIKDDPRNDGIKVWVHYKWLVNPMELKYDLRNISDESSPLDVNRVMLQFSEKIKDKQFSKVYLSYRGEDKFYFKGDYFQNLGKEYEFQNPIYTLRTIPENIYTLNGEPRYGSWTGGWLGVASKQMEDINTFAKDWYLDDVIKDIK